jgi:hypothetical protein
MRKKGRERRKVKKEGHLTKKREEPGLPFLF